MSGSSLDHLRQNLQYMVLAVSSYCSQSYWNSQLVRKRPVLRDEDKVEELFEVLEEFKAGEERDKGSREKHEEEEEFL